MFGIALTEQFSFTRLLSIKSTVDSKENDVDINCASIRAVLDAWKA